MTQLFYNLMSNALKFSAGQPQIDISATLLSSGQQAAIDGLNSRRRYYEIKVQDNGIGFEQKYADRIFSAFQRLVKNSEYEGTGIGLTMCRKIAENHEGRISAISEPGIGSLFIVYLPGN